MINITLLGDSSGEVDSELALPPGEDVETCIKRISSETQMLFSKWKETLQYVIIQLHNYTIYNEKYFSDDHFLTYHDMRT